MATAKTEGTELSVAFGLMQLDPSDHLNEKQVRRHFEGTLPYAKYADFFDKFARAEKYYRRFYAIGLNLTRRYPQFASSEIRSLKWEGPKRQTTSVSLSVDLVVNNTRISVKADSDVVYNRSAFTLFEQMPKGLPEIRRSPNWYLLTAPEEYQTWYAYARDCWGGDLPISVEAFHGRGTTRKRRSEFARRIKSSKREPEFGDFQRLYVQFCDAVAERTSTRFNNSYSTLRYQPYFDTANTAFVRTLFRIGEANYVHCGLEGSSSFAVEIPDLSSWSRAWKLRRVVASPDMRIHREQPVVMLRATCENRTTHEQHEFGFEVQVRWSHGRFCGNPEAKLYKQFLWRDVLGVITLFGDDRYEKVRRITTGGFGTVYEAMDRQSGQRFALKELCASDETVHERARFVREVHLMSTLNHPNIIQIVDYDIDSDPPWFVMPLADCSLVDMVDRPGGMDDGDLLELLFRQVLSAIAYAHGQRVVHRDLKPENILVFDGRFAQVSDFGLGKRLDPTSSDWGLTDSRESLGTRAYVAPEQMLNFANADERSDIYSLGKILYFCLTGLVPDPVMDLDRVHPELASVIRICTRENPAERYRSVAELATALGLD